jgi:putative Mg2+ transporter-C (MgtC) family protein
MLLAVALGGIIGIEREWFNKPTGFRSIILVCLGATIFTICSHRLGTIDDHSRIASNIVMGIGFVGGVIFKGKHGIEGITTAVNIGVTASTGMLVGCFHWEIACIATALVISVLFMLNKVQIFTDWLNSVRNYKVVYPYHLYKARYISQMAAGCGLQLRSNHHHKLATLLPVYGRFKAGLPHISALYMNCWRIDK